MSHNNNFQKEAFRLSSLLLNLFLIWLAFYDSTSV